MADGTVTLALDGDPSLADLATALGGLRILLDGLAGSATPTAEIVWTVESLQSGSAIATFRGTAGNPDVVKRAADDYLGVAQDLVRGTLSHRAPQVGAGARQIASIINGRVASVRFETESDDVVVTSSVAPQNVVTLQERAPGFGAVTGKIQTVSSRGSLHFTLYHIRTEKAISCYLAPSYEDIMRGG